MGEDVTFEVWMKWNKKRSRGNSGRGKEIGEEQNNLW